MAEDNPMTDQLLISQSLIKAVRKYRKDEYCGLRLKAVWIDKTHREPETTAMRVGQWFEYCATGQKNYYGEIPRPDRTPSKAPTWAKNEYKTEIKRIEQTDYFGQFSAKDLKEAAKIALYDNSPIGAKFQHAEDQAQRFKDYAKKYGWTWTEADTGQKIEQDGLSGFIDLRPTIPKDSQSWPKPGSPGYRGDWPKWSERLSRVTVDLKHSGLMDNYFDPLGWEPSALDIKHELMIQAVQYTVLTGAPFFFFVFSASSGNFDARLIPVIVSQGRIEEHRIEVKEVRNILSQNIRSGFRAFPSVKHCEDCPLAETCEKKASFPLPERIIRY